jgi:hypothetical protein
MIKPPLWRKSDGSPVSCTEKVKVMNENYQELSQMLQDAFEDGLLMEADETQLRQAFQALIDALQNPYAH